MKANRFPLIVILEKGGALPPLFFALFKKENPSGSFSRLRGEKGPARKFSQATFRGKLVCFLAAGILLAGCGSPVKITPNVSDTQTAAAPDLTPGALLVTGSGGAELSTTTAPGITQTPAPGGEAIQAIEQAQQALFNVPAFRAQTTITNLSTRKTITSTLEYEAPDRLRLLDSSGETIVVSQTTYVKPNGSNWRLAPANLTGVLEQLREASGFQGQKAPVVNAKQLGAETLDGNQAQLFQYNMTYEGVTSQVKIWIGTKDHLPLKMEITAEAAAVRTQTTITYTYGANIHIQAPSLPK